MMVPGVHQTDSIIEDLYDQSIDVKEIESLIMLFNRNIEYQFFSYAMVENAIAETNKKACENGVNCYIEHIHLDMSGLAEIFIRSATDPHQVEVLQISGAFPSGQQYDFSGKPVMRQPPVIDVDVEDIFPYIPEPEEAVCMVEGKVIDYVINNYDANDIRQYGAYMYDIIEQRISDFADEVAEETFRGKVGFVDYSEKTYADRLRDNLPVNAFFKLIEDMLNSSMTEEEKLSEVSKAYYL